jgi:hypothetical protein
MTEGKPAIRVQTPIYKIAKNPATCSNKLIEPDCLKVGDGFGLPASHSTIWGILKKNIESVTALGMKPSPMTSVFMSQVGRSNLGGKFFVSQVRDDSFSFMDNQGVERTVPFYIDGLVAERGDHHA